MHFKEELYEQYYKLHILPRKGPLSIKQLNKKLKVFDLHFGELLPKDFNANIIDAGCGNGSLVYWLQKKGYIVCSWFSLKNATKHVFMLSWKPKNADFCSIAPLSVEKQF